MSALEPVESSAVAAAVDDGVGDVPADWYAAMRLAGRIHNTPFVPKGMRGQPATVLAAILYGQELGLGPMQALASIHVIEGTPSASAELQRALVHRAGHTLRLVHLDTERCALYGKRCDTGEEAEVSYTMADARTANLAGKGPWKAHPKHMLLARATSLLCRAMFSDVVKGLSYTPDEAAEIGGGTWEPEPGEFVDPITGALPAGATGSIARMVDPYEAAARARDDGMTEAQNRKIRALYGKLGITDRDEQRATSAALVLPEGRPLATHNDLTVDQSSRLIETLTAVEAGFLEFVTDGPAFAVVGVREASPDAR